jgi:diguanylate cyclase (GGDEF)-like protein
LPVRRRSRVPLAVASNGIAAGSAKAADPSTSSSGSPAMSQPTHEAADRLQALMHGCPSACAFVRDMRLESVGEALELLFSPVGPGGLAGQPTRSVMVSDAAHDGLGQQLAAAFAAGVPFDGEVELMRRDGSRFWGRLRAAPVRWDDPAGLALWFVDDVTRERQHRLQPHWQSTHDPLTELANRREFDRRLSDHLSLRRRQPVSVLVVDIDRFAGVNALLGEDGGDRALRTIGARVLAKVRASDLVARLHADCFGVLLPDCELHYALLVADKLCDGIARERLRSGVKSLHVTASIGATQLGAAVRDPQAVIDACAEAVVQAKAAGGNTVRVAGWEDFDADEALEAEPEAAPGG